MTKFYAALLIGVSLLFTVKAAHAIRVEPSIVIASSPQLVTYGSTAFYCYSNGLIVPSNHYYNTRTIRNMARLSHSRGMRHVYLLAPSHQYGLPTRYQRIAYKEFSRYGISYDYYYPNQYRHNRYHRSYDYYNRYDRYNHYDRRRGHGKSGFYFTIRF